MVRRLFLFHWVFICRENRANHIALYFPHKRYANFMPQVYVDNFEPKFDCVERVVVVETTRVNGKGD